MTLKEKIKATEELTGTWKLDFYKPIDIDNPDAGYTDEQLFKEDLTFLQEMMFDNYNVSFEGIGKGFVIKNNSIVDIQKSEYAEWDGFDGYENLDIKLDWLLPLHKIWNIDNYDYKKTANYLDSKTITTKQFLKNENMRHPFGIDRLLLTRKVTLKAKEFGKFYAKSSPNKRISIYLFLIKANNGSSIINFAFEDSIYAGNPFGESRWIGYAPLKENLRIFSNIKDAEVHY